VGTALATTGLPGLANRPKAVSRRKVTESYQQVLEQALDSPPGAYGYPFAIWTLERLRDHLTQTTGVQVSLQWLSVVLKEQGYVYRRPKHDLTHLQDPTAKSQAAALLEELKKGHKQVLSGFSLWTKRP
jgi:transposase